MSGTPFPTTTTTTSTTTGGFTTTTTTSTTTTTTTPTTTTTTTLTPTTTTSTTAAPVNASLTLATADPVYNDEAMVFTLSGVTISPGDIITVTIADNTIQSAIDGTYVTGQTFQNTDVFNCVGATLFLDQYATNFGPNSGTWNDLSYSGNDATFVSNPTYSDSNDGYFIFDGTASYAYGNCGLTNNSDFSVNFWMYYISNNAGNQGILSTWDTSWNGFAIGTGGSGSNIRSWTNNGAGGGLDWATTASIRNGWHMFTLTYKFSTKTQRVYIDGVFKASESFGSAITHSTLQIARGGATGSTQLASYPLTNARITHLGFYNSVFTDNQVAYMFSRIKSRFGL